MNVYFVVRWEEQKETALHHAAFHGLPELVALLVEHGADVNAARFNGSTPLDCAAGRKVRRVLEELGAETRAERAGRVESKRAWQRVRRSRVAAAQQSLRREGGWGLRSLAELEAELM